MKQGHWIFLSPHFDDVALSCGGLLWELTSQGDLVEVWTIMAGYPWDEDYSTFAQQNHLAWGKAGREAIDMRRAEDQAACDVLGAKLRHFDWPDVIYRKCADSGDPVVNTNEELFNEPPEPALVDEIAAALINEIPQTAALALPMGLGGHLDHRAVVEAGKQLPGVHYYYADYPYILWRFDSPILTTNTFQKIPRNFSKEALQAWQDAVLCYRSQLSSFWRDDEEARLALNNYLAGGGGRLWITK